MSHFFMRMTNAVVTSHCFSPCSFSVGFVCITSHVPCDFCILVFFEYITQLWYMLVFLEHVCVWTKWKNKLNDKLTFHKLPKIVLIILMWWLSLSHIVLISFLKSSQFLNKLFRDLKWMREDIFLIKKMFHYIHLINQCASAFNQLCS